MNHEPARWSRTARPMGTTPTDQPTGVDRPSTDAEAGPPEQVHSEQMRPEQMHLVSQGFPVRIQRAFVAGGVALALALGGSLAASLTGAGRGPASAPAGTSVSVQAQPAGLVVAAQPLVR